jgi:TPR repeat protein
MTRYKPFLFVFLLLAYEGEAMPTRAGGSKRIASRTELEQLSLKAVRGDIPAAQKLGWHYSEEIHALDTYWFTIGAESGDSICQWSLACALTFDNKTDTRGIFWTKTAARNNDDSAIRQLGYLGISPDEGPPDDSRFIFESGELSESDLEACKDGALQGSQKAALVLAEHYRAANDAESAEYWYRIGAQNGNAECQYRYSQILFYKPTELDRERGKFWLNRATENGYHGQ